jgi:uncharacterized protein YdaU (DUF1376 family)
MTPDWYPWYARDFRKDTLHLTLAQDGAYRRLIDEYMLSAAPLPDDDVALARILGVQKKQWLAVSTVVRAFFEASHGRLVHKRCEQELHAQALHLQSKRTRAKNAANARWRNERENKDIVASAMRPHSTSNTSAMQSDATRQDIKKKSPSSIESAGSLASALRTGALASQLEPEAPPPLPHKRPNETSLEELNTILAKRRNTA